MDADERDQWLQVAVAGAHMSGMPLNHELEALGAQLVAQRRTAAVYRMFAVGKRPMLLRHPQDGSSFNVEVYRLPIRNVGIFMRDSVKPPLSIGDVLLDDNSSVKGFLGESYAAETAIDISAFGGWRQYCNRSSFSL